jgi:hypothetical protein
MHITAGAGSATFQLTAESEADRALLDAIHLDGAHALHAADWRHTPQDGGLALTGVTLQIDRKHPAALERETGRQLLRAVRECFRLGLGENALHGHIGLQPANPDTQHKLAAQLDQFELVLQALRAAVGHTEAVRQEVDSTHSDASSGCDTAILNGSACAAQAAAPTGNTHLPPALRPHAVPRFHAPRTHQHIELHGITVADHTVALPGWEAAGLPRREVIWLAMGLEGHALQATQALELAEALRLIATAQIQRLQGKEGGAA